MEPRRVLPGLGVIDFRAVVLHSYSCDADQINGKTAH